MEKILQARSIDWIALQLLITAQANLMSETIKKHGNKMGKTFCILRRWLNKQELPSNFTTMKDFCYALVSLNTNDWYIGSASEGLKRWKQHILDAKNVWTNKLSNKKKHRLMNIHKCMNRTGVHNWIMIPITNQVIGRKRIERRLIKHLQPTLNMIWNKKRKEQIRKRPPKKYRNKSQNNEPLHPYTTFFVGQSPFVDIFDAIKIHSGGEPMSLTWIKGELDSSNYVRLRKTYTTLKGKIDTAQETLYFQSSKQLKALIQSNRKGKIWIETIITSDIITHFTKLALNLRKKNTTKNITNEMIWKLFAAKRFIRKKPLRQAIQYQLNKLCKERFGITIPNKITIRVPYNQTLKLGTVQQMAVEVFEQMDIPKEAKDILKRKIRPVYTRQPNIGDIAMNFMQAAKNMDMEKATCVCKQKNDKHSHRIEKIADIQNRELQPLQKHRKVVPFPDDPGKWSRVYYEFTKLKSIVTKMDIKMKQLNIYEHINKYLKGKRIYNKKGILSAYQTRLATRQLKGWLITYADKNPGMLVACCPEWYREKMKETFKHDNDEDTYQKSDKKEENIIKEWETFYKEHLLKVGTFNKKGRLPYGYILPKFKDLNRTRPIVSYFHHPLKNILNIFARAITFLLKSCTEIKHLTIWTTDSLMANIQMQTDGWMNKEEYRYRMITGDIKNMYTMLPPEEQVQAVQWLLDIMTQGRRCQYITVKRRGREEARFGRTYNKNAYVEINTYNGEL